MNPRKSGSPSGMCVRTHSRVSVGVVLCAVTGHVSTTDCTLVPRRYPGEGQRRTPFKPDRDDGPDRLRNQGRSSSKVRNRVHTRHSYQGTSETGIPYDKGVHLETRPRVDIGTPTRTSGVFQEVGPGDRRGTESDKVSEWVEPNWNSKDTFKRLRRETVSFYRSSGTRGPDGKGLEGRTDEFYEKLVPFSSLEGVPLDSLTIRLFP